MAVSAHAPPTSPTLFPYTTLFRSLRLLGEELVERALPRIAGAGVARFDFELLALGRGEEGELGEAERSEEHTSELQSRPQLVCRLLLEKKLEVGTNSDGKARITGL